jgi:hypothetical protein
MIIDLFDLRFLNLRKIEYLQTLKIMKELEYAPGRHCQYSERLLEVLELIGWPELVKETSGSCRYHVGFCDPKCAL